MTATTRYVLAIEAAVAGGSIALLSAESTHGTWNSPNGEAKSEELLLRISELLEASGVEPARIAHIAVSRGPGSYTGIRIGLATAMGLAESLQIPAKGVLLLPAIAEGAPEGGPRIPVVPIGRNGFSWQLFDGTGTEQGEPETGDLEWLVSSLKNNPLHTVLAHSQAHDLLGFTGYRHEAGIVDVGCELAVFVGLSSFRRDQGLEPFYARPSQQARSGGK